MMNDKKPITESVLKKAAQCTILNNILVGGEVNELSELETHNN